MSEPHDRLDRTYRSLAREEPPASLDAAILSAARRAVARPSLARRWGVPVSLAALLVLAVGVTLEMQREEPGIEVSAPGARVSTQGTPSPQAQAPLKAQSPSNAEPQAQGQLQPKARPQPSAEPPRQTQPAIAAPAKPAELKPKRASPALDEARRKDAPQAAPPPAPEASAARQSPRPFAAAPAPSGSAYAPAPASSASALATPRAAEQRLAAPAANMAKRSAAAGATADTTAVPGDPHAELEKIAKLRESGRDAEADRALEEFRKRYPGYRIDDAMWQRVKPR